MYLGWRETKNGNIILLCPLGRSIIGWVNNIKVVITEIGGKVGSG